MADVITRFKIETTQYDSKLRDASKGLAEYTRQATMAGNEFGKFTQKNVEAARALGSITPSANNAKDKVRELVGAFNDVARTYNALTKEQQQSDFGKAMAESLGQLSQQLKEAKKELYDNGEAGKGTSGILELLKDKFTVNIDALTLFNKGLQVAGVALNVAKDAFFASEATVDEWGRIVDSSKSLYEGFLTALNTGDISGYLGRIDEIVQAARAAYDELDRLGTMKTIQAPKMSAQQTENERMRMMIQTGRYIAPVDGRRASMKDGQLLTPEQIRGIETKLQNGMKTVVSLVGNEVKQTGKAIDAVYNRQAQELGLSLKEFRKGTSSMAEFDKRMAGYDQYQKWREQHTTIDMQSGREIVARGNPFEQFAKWGTFRVDGQRYNDLVRLIQQRDQQAGQAYSMQSQAYRTMNRAEGVTVSKLMRGETTGGTTGGTTTTRTAATPKTEEQQNQTRIAELVKQYQDLATAAKTADDAQKAGLTERMTKIQGEIKTLQDRNTELKKFADEARQVQYPVGSLPQLNEQLKTLQTEQAKALDAKQWKDYQKQIEQTQYQIDALKGKWQDGLQATFKLNIEQQGSTDIKTAKPEDITVTFKADDADVLAKVRDIEGVTIDPKTITVTAQTQEAIAALQRVDGLTIQPKTAEVTFKADDADVLAKVRDIEGVTIDPKTITVTAQTQEAIAALQRVDGLTIQPKTAEVTFKADDADVLAKVRDIEGVTIDPKTLTVTANTADAYNKVQELLKSVDGKTVTFTVQPKMETGTSIQNDAGMSAYISSLKQQLETADYGTSLYNGLSAQLADMTTLQNLVGESLKAGLSTAMFDAADATGKDFWTRAMEGSVEDTDWQAIVEKINEALKAAGLDTISLNFKTGDVKNQANEMTKNWKGAASAIQSVGQAMSQIEDPAAKVMGTIAQAVATVALTFASSLKGTVTPWDWIAAAAAGTATMISTISAIHSSTGYANGGVIKGNSYSGDNIGGMVDGGAGGFVGLNAGEVVLNAAQQRGVASALSEGGNRRIEVFGRLSGETIYLSSDRYTRRTGRGTIMTWK